MFILLGFPLFWRDPRNHFFFRKPFLFRTITFVPPGNVDFAWFSHCFWRNPRNYDFSQKPFLLLNRRPCWRLKLSLNPSFSQGFSTFPHGNATFHARPPRRTGCLAEPFLAPEMSILLGFSTVLKKSKKLWLFPETMTFAKQAPVLETQGISTVFALFQKAARTRLACTGNTVNNTSEPS